MKPAHCSYATFPSFGTFKSSFLSFNFPFSSLYFTIFLAIPLLIPDTYAKSDGVAVFMSTPTLFTASSTTQLNSALSSFDLHHVDIVPHQWPLGLS